MDRQDVNIQATMGPQELTATESKTLQESQDSIHNMYLAPKNEKEKVRIMGEIVIKTRA